MVGSGIHRRHVWLLWASLEAAAQNPKAGAIDGCIDGIRHEGDTFYIYGGACQREFCARVPIVQQQTDYYCADELAERETDQDTDLGASTLIYR